MKDGKRPKPWTTPLPRVSLQTPLRVARSITGGRGCITDSLKDDHDIAYVMTELGIGGGSELDLESHTLAQNQSPLAMMMMHALVKGFQIAWKRSW